MQSIEASVKSDNLSELWINNILLISLIRSKVSGIELKEEFDSVEDQFDYLTTLAKDNLNIPTVIPVSQFVSSQFDFVSIIIYFSFFFCLPSYLNLFSPSIPEGDSGLGSTVLTFLQEHSQSESSILSNNSLLHFDNPRILPKKQQSLPSTPRLSRSEVSHVTKLQQAPGEYTVHIHKSSSLKESNRISLLDNTSHQIYAYTLLSDSKFHMVICLDDFGNTTIEVKLMSKKGIEIPFQLKKYDLRYELEFNNPLGPGDVYLVHISIKGMPILGSPFIYGNRFFEMKREVYRDYKNDKKSYLVSSLFPKARMVTIQPNNVREPQFPQLFPLGQPIQLQLDQLSTKNAKEKLKAVAYGENVGELTPELSQQANGICLVTLRPKIPDTYDLHIKWDGKPLPNSPFRFTVMKFSHPEKCKVLGMDSNLAWIRINEPLRFQVDANESGIGEITVKANQPQDPIQSDLSITREHENLFSICYRPRVVGAHRLHLFWNDAAIPSSPISFSVYSHDKPHPSALQIINIHEAPFILNRDDVLELNVKGDFSLIPTLAGYGLLANNPTEKIPLIYEETDRKEFKVIFEPIDPGEYQVFILLDGDNIDGSPFEVQYGMGDAAACYVRGLNDRHYFVEQPIEFTLDASEAGVGKGVIRVGTHCTESGEPGMLNVEDNRNGTYTVNYTPKKSKLHLLDITWNNDPVLGSPWEISIEEPFILPLGSSNNVVETNRQIQVKLPNEVCNFENVRDTDIQVECVGESSGKISAMVSKNEKGERVINFIPKFADIYSLSVRMNGNELVCSPWKIEAIDINDTLSDILAEMDSKIEVNRPAVLNIKLTDTTHTSRLQVEVNGPSGSCEVELITDENNPFHMYGQFSPRAVGKYTVSVLAYSKHVPGSPFNVKAVITEAARAAGECFIVEKENKALKSTLLLGEACKFTISTESAGKGELSIVIQGPDHADCHSTNNNNRTHSVQLTAESCGQYQVQISWGGYEIVGSPLVINFCEEIDHPELNGISLENKVLGVGVPFRFNLSIPHVLGELDVFSIPSISALIQVIHKDTEHYEVSVIPKQIGEYHLGVKVGDYHVVGSPYPITYVSFCDSNRCSLIVPSKNKCISVGEKIIYQVSTKNAGVGILEAVLINDEAKEMIPVIVRKLDENVFNIEIIPGRKDRYALHILYGNNPIPGSPFSLTLSDSNQEIQCVVDGDFVRRCVVGEENCFQVICSAVLPESLYVRIQDSSGKETPSEIVPLRNTVHEAKFMLSKPGSYNVSVKHNDVDVIGSPFTITAITEPIISPISVKQFPQEILLGERLEYVIDCTEAVDSGDLAVKAIGPTFTKILEDMTIDEERNNELKASFVPKQGGTYTLFTTWNDIEVRGSPFSVEVLIRSNPSKVFVYGKGLYNGKVGQNCEFVADTRLAGPGELLITLTGPQDSFILNTIPDRSYDKFDHVHYMPEIKGTYKLEIFWAGEPISESPFNILIS